MRATSATTNGSPTGSVERSGEGDHPRPTAAVAGAGPRGDAVVALFSRRGSAASGARLFAP